MRTGEGALVRFRRDVPDALAGALESLARSEPLVWPPPRRPVHEARYLGLLADHASVERVWAGPAFVFGAVSPAEGDDVVAIDETNADLLRGGLDAWLADVPHRRPFMAALSGGRAVALCASVRISAAVHCAGVETLATHRCQGHAVRVALAWATAVRAVGATPFYSTSWDNPASQGVARRLGLELAGVDFHVG